MSSAVICCFNTRLAGSKRRQAILFLSRAAWNIKRPHLKILRYLMSSPRIARTTLPSPNPGKAMGIPPWIGYRDEFAFVTHEKEPDPDRQVASASKEPLANTSPPALPGSVKFNLISP